MATGTKQQWRDLSRQMRENTTPRELGEAVLALAEGKRAAPRTDRRTWIAVAIGAAFVLLIGMSREVTNSQALAAQVQEISEAHAEAQEQTRIAIDAQAEAERQASIAEEERAKAEELAAEKTQRIQDLRAIASQTVERAHAELLGLREEDSNQVAGEPFASMLMAGEILRQGGIVDEEFWDRYDGATHEILTQLAQYLNPQLDVSGVVIVESKDD